MSLPTLLNISVFLLYSSTFLLSIQASDNDVLLEFKPHENEDLYHVKIHNTTGDIYIGAYNSLYRLSEDFSIMVNISTCSSDDCDNINKILEIDYDYDRLITCGGGNNGRCEGRSLVDLTLDGSDVFDGLVSELSAVGIIAPGLLDDTKRTVLYISSGHTSFDPIEYSYEIINTRRFLETKLIFQTRNLESTSYTESYKNKPIQFTTALNYEGYTYFVAVRPNDTDYFHSRLSRVCQDNSFDTLSEIYIRCVVNNVDYNLVQDMYVGPVGTELGTSLGLQAGDNVLYGVFAKGDGSGVATGQSAMCIYKWNDIEDAFFKALNGCINVNNDVHTLDYADEADCPQSFSFTAADIQSLMCPPNDGRQLYRRYSQGIYTEAAVSEALLTVNDKILTSVTTAIEDNHTIAFIGTDNGQLIKAELTNKTSSRVYETVTIDIGQEVRSDTFIDDTSNYIIALTATKLVKLQVANCSRFMTCDECIRPGKLDADPYCGWCTLYKKCTRFKECQQSPWLPSNSAQCIEIRSVEPPFIPLTYENIRISLTVEQLPPLNINQTYNCKFGDFQSSAIKDGETLTCYSPPSSHVPQIPTSQASVDVILSVHSSVTDVDFISTDFTFFDCSAITSCSECVSSFTCDWCVYDNKCTHNASTLCTADDKIILNGNPTSPPNGFQGQGSCPQIYQPNEELIHANIEKEVIIPIKNLPNATKVNSYECELEIETQTVRIPATVDESNSNITCSQYTYDYTTDDKQEVNAYIKVFWNGNVVDNAYQVTLYKCSVQRPDCSRCYSMNTTRSALDCVWCTGDQCSYSPFCSSIVNECPSPVIIQTLPISVATVTTQPEPDFTEVIELFGTDFGKMMSDIDNIMIDNKECVIVADGFNIALQSVKCKAPVFDSVSQREVIITVQGKTSAPIVILYQNPIISEVSPSFGIQAGGTSLTFSGSNLNTGNDITVSIDGSECYVTSINENQIMCTTSNYTTSGAEVAVTVTFGNAVRDGPTFNYTTNPTVTDFQPNKGIQAGGQNIRVTGTNFQYVQRATMLLNSVSAENNCIILSNEEMDCESPPADLSTSGHRSRRQADQTVLPLTFSFDGFVPTLNGDFGFSVYTNPTYYPFGNNMSFYGENVVDGIYRYDKDIDEFMKLMGSDINLASDVEDVEVFIGSVKCTVNSISRTVVLVEVPDKEPSPVDGEDHPIVKIQHGNINVTFGPIEYSSNIQVEIIIVCSVIGVVILLFFIILLIHRRRIKQYDKENKKVYVEMERIQEEVQEEAQSAFADLTVYLTDLTADDFQGIVMPFVTRKQYVCNMMFNGFEHIPDSQNKDSENITKRLQQLSELLLNKSFLLTFIKMLDSNSKVTVKEKCNIASLLVVEFLIEDKMDYFTEVLEELLIDNIDYCVSSHKAKQVLARTDSVTAKLLSNWIALSMYNYLKDYAGHPLYVLYHALKLRIEMGPVDAITGRATYSLNLDDCLQSDERPQVITLNAIQNSDSGEFQKVKVLSCDTISQVKEKILDTLYKNDPYSDRPKVQHLDLSWRHGRGGHLILSDIDATSQRNGQLIKLNTIGDLIPKAVAASGCTVALVKKQTVANADIDLDVVSPATATPAAGAASTFVFDNVALEPDDGAISMKSLEESGMKQYHLTLDNVGRTDPKRKSLFNMHRNAKRDIKEIKFLRAMATKEAIKEYVDEMFNTIFWASSSQPPIPPSVKYLFDLFDQEAKKQGVDDLTLTTWKNNSVPSKFWVQVIKHPEYIFDIKQTGPIMGTLSIISRTFIESCSPKKIQLTKESEVNRLLYTKEMPHYRSLVDNFYKKVQTAEFQRASFVQELHNSGKNFRDIFSRTSTLEHLFSYLKDHTDKLTSLLQQDEGYETQRNLRQLRSVFTEPNKESSTRQHSKNPYDDVSH